MATMSTPDSITYAVDDYVATITLNRPRVFNALTLDDYQLLARLVRQADEEPFTTVTVVTGKGKYFSACVYLYFLIQLTTRLGLFVCLFLSFSLVFNE